MAKSKIEVLSAGTKLAYAVETVAGTMPTTATHIPNIKEIPDFSAEPDQIEVTDLGDTKYKRFIPGLIDLSGASGRTVNNVVEINCSITVNGEIVRTDEEITVNEPTIE